MFELQQWQAAISQYKVALTQIPKSANVARATCYTSQSNLGMLGEHARSLEVAIEATWASDDAELLATAWTNCVTAHGKLGLATQWESGPAALQHYTESVTRYEKGMAAGGLAAGAQARALVNLKEMKDILERRTNAEQEGGRAGGGGKSALPQTLEHFRLERWAEAVTCFEKVLERGELPAGVERDVQRQL